MNGVPKDPGLAKRCYSEFLGEVRKELKQKAPDSATRLLDKFIKIISSRKN